MLSGGFSLLVPSLLVADAKLDSSKTTIQTKRRETRKRVFPLETRFVLTVSPSLSHGVI